MFSTDNAEGEKHNHKGKIKQERDWRQRGKWLSPKEGLYANCEEKER